MFVFPWYALNDEIKILENPANGENLELSRTDHMRYMKVPFIINVMSGGQYEEKQKIRFGGISSGKKFMTKQEGVCRIENGKIIFPDEWGIKMHRHDYYELMYVLEGSVEQKIENSSYVYHKGEGCFINRNAKHQEISGKDFFVVYLCLSKEYVQELLEYTHKATGSIYRFLASSMSGKSSYKKDYLYISCTSQDDSVNKAYDLFEEMTKELIRQEPGYLHIFCGLVERLFGVFQDTNFYKIRYVTLDCSAEEQLFEKIKLLIEENPRKYSRQELSEILNYSGDYLNKIVKKFTGLTITGYSQKVLLKKAKLLLEEGDMSVSSVMEQLGFHGSSRFYEMFKEEFHMLPGDCKKTHKNV